jgi:putative DNA primase/helicase
MDSRKFVKAEDLAHGRWHEILVAAGIDSSFLKYKEGPCPLCGGKSRFRFKDVGKRAEGRGEWFCKSCRAGNGFSLLMGYRQCTFEEACSFIKQHFGVTNGAAVALPAPAKLGRSGEQGVVDVSDSVRRELHKLWNAAAPIQEGDAAWCYLRKRLPLLTQMPKVLRFHAALPYWSEGDDGKPRLVGKFPALLAIAQGPDGRACLLHKTYLTSDGRKADLDPPRKYSKSTGIEGGAVRLMAVTGDTLGIAEGIETSFSASFMHGFPTWSALDASRLAKFQIPEELKIQVRRLVIFADNDKPDMRGKRAGNDAAAVLAARARKEGLRVRVMLPSSTERDFDDIACALRAR